MNITDFKNRHLGQRCFLLGSGPSLASMDLSGLRSEITFSCNRGYLLFDKLGFPTTYWALEDLLDYEQWGKGFEDLQGPIKFVADDVPFKGDYCKTPFIRDMNCEKFSSDPPFYFGGSVMYLMLQLAAYMGCNIAYLLGNDFKWTNFYTLDDHDNNKWITPDQDTDHFDLYYWPKGSRSFPPQPERMRKAFFNARGNGLRIINVTPDSALDVFETRDYCDILNENPEGFYTQQHPEEINQLSNLLKKDKLRNVIEIGVLNGGTSAKLHELNTELVIGIDKENKAWLRNYLPRFCSVKGDSQTPSTIDKVMKLLNGKMVDFIFVDGNHSYNGVKSDWEVYKQMIYPGGIIAFHDINADPNFFEIWEEGGVPRFWKELQADKQEFTVNGNWGGIGVVRI